jgi:hypothetical protein
MTAGIFFTEQPKYAALGIATFPLLADKRPAVANFNRMGLPASNRLATQQRFANTPGLFTLAGERSGLTVGDVDAKGSEGERLLADIQREYGPAKVIGRTGSGGFHAFYRHNGEARIIRPTPERAFDLLGGGNIILPPSVLHKGPYEIIEGKLEDFAALTAMRQPATQSTIGAPPAIDDLRSARGGERDGKFWPHVARMAHQVRSLDELIEVARELNEMMAEPWSDTEVHSEIVKRCKYWWDKTQKGQNRYGTGRYVRSTHAELTEMLGSPDDQDAYILLSLLRMHHWGRDFILANALHERLGWSRKRFAAARARLIETGRIILIKPATLRQPPLCRLAA